MPCSAGIPRFSAYGGLEAEQEPVVVLVPDLAGAVFKSEVPGLHEVEKPFVGKGLPEDKGEIVRTGVLIVRRKARTHFRNWYRVAPRSRALSVMIRANAVSEPAINVARAYAASFADSTIVPVMRS